MQMRAGPDRGAGKAEGISGKPGKGAVRHRSIPENPGWRFLRADTRKAQGYCCVEKMAGDRLCYRAHETDYKNELTAREDTQAG
jgi:hypothetical protein